MGDGTIIAGQGTLNLPIYSAEDFRRKILESLMPLDESTGKPRLDLPMYKQPRVVLITGKAGIGKTSIIKDICTELGIDQILVGLSGMSPDEILGNPRAVERTDLKRKAAAKPGDPDYEEGFKEYYDNLDEGAKLQTAFIHPQHLPNVAQTTWAQRTFYRTHATKYKEGDPICLGDVPFNSRKFIAGILFFDEITACSEGCRQAISKLCDTSRGFNNYTLPDYWMVVCAGNEIGDGNNYEGITGTLLNRAEAFRYELTYSEWRKWALKNNIYPPILAYLKCYPDDFWNYTMDDSSIDTQQFASPRAWVAVSDGFNRCAEINDIKTLSTQSILRLATSVGAKTAQQFATFLQVQSRLVDFDEIAAGRGKSNNWDSEPDAAYLQAAITAPNVERVCLEYFNSRSEEDLQRVINTFQWMQYFISAQSDAGMELLSYCQKGSKVNTADDNTLSTPFGLMLLTMFGIPCIQVSNYPFLKGVPLNQEHCKRLETEFDGFVKLYQEKQALMETLNN